jgi:hypothetical protein
MSKSNQMTMAVLGVAAGVAWGDTIHESAPMSFPQSGGAAISQFQSLGSRFSVDEMTQVTGIRGHLGGSPQGGDIFGAIVALDGPAGLPVGDPFDAEELLAWTTFEPTFPSSDILVPLDLTLEPGDYALVFGTNQFGADSIGFMPFNFEDNPGSSYFGWQPTGWLDGGFMHTRFVVEGIVVPGPTTFFLVLLSYSLLGKREPGVMDSKR